MVSLTLRLLPHLGEAKVNPPRMEEQRSLLRRLHEWAVSLDREGLVKLGTYHAKGGDMMTLLPRLRAANAGLVTIYNYSGTPSLQILARCL